MWRSASAARPWRATSATPTRPTWPLRTARNTPPRSKVLSDKARAVEAEIRLQEAEYNEMLSQIRKARANRARLSASAGRTQARDSLGGGDDLFGELDRMAERIVDGEAAAGAEEALFDDAQDFDDQLGTSRREEAIDARLEELKRRMRDR